MRSLRAAVLAALLISAPGRAQSVGGRWLVQYRDTSGTAFAIRMTFRQHGLGRWEAYSREGAAAEMVPRWKAVVGRVLRKLPPHGALVYLEGTSTGSTLTGELQSQILKYRYVKGELIGDRIRLELRSDTLGPVAATLEGNRDDALAPVRNYGALSAAIRQSITDNIFDPRLARRPSWQAYFAEMDKRLARARDDIDVLGAFYSLRPMLETSHFELFRNPRLAPLAMDSVLKLFNRTNPNTAVSLSFPVPSVALLSVRRWDSVTAVITRAFQRIDSAGARTLLIDLRGNPGGDATSMSPIAHLFRDTAQAGVFVGHKWFAAHDAPPKGAELAALPFITDEGRYEHILHGIRSGGAMVGRVAPREPYFGGNVYVLIDGRSGSASEPLAYMLKTTKRATLIGERTAGAMLAAPPHTLIDGWMLVLPIADFYFTDGHRLESVGVPPDISVPRAEVNVAAGREIAKTDPYTGALMQGVGSFWLSRWNDSRRFYMEAARLQPDSLTPLNGLLQAAIAAKDWRAGFAAAQAMKKRDTGLGPIYQIGRLAALSGLRLGEGEAALRQYLSRPYVNGLASHAAAHWRLGMILEAKGDREGARAELTEAVRMEPANAEFLAALKRLGPPR